MSFSVRYLINKKNIFRACASYVHHWQGYVNGSPCDEDVMRCIVRYMDENKDLISAQRESDRDFDVFCKKLISKVTFEMIVSNQYYGRILPTIRHVHKTAMDELLYVGYISQREYDESFDAMKSLLSERMPAIHKEFISNMERLLQTKQE